MAINKVEAIQYVVEQGDAHLHKHYSGRAMYGKTCIAISGSWKTCQDVIAGVIQHQVAELLQMEEDEQPQAQAELNEFIGQLVGFRSDNLGHDVVLYFTEISGEDA